MKILSGNQDYHILVDERTRAVLTISTRKDIIVLLKDCLVDVHVIFWANQPNYTGFLSRGFSLLSEKPEDYPKWSWNHKKRVFRRTGSSVLDESLLAKSQLANSKRAVITKIQAYLADDRISFSQNMPYQETVYFIKKTQAMDFRKSGYDESLIMNYPYVAQYADFADISMQQSADNILFRAQLYEDRLLRNESLRLKYYNAVKEMHSQKQESALFKGLYHELYGNSLE
jgi:hypothetical protein